MAEKLWKYQLVRYLAPKIMATILETILGKAEKVKRVTISCIDDILEDESIVSTKEVIS